MSKCKNCGATIHKEDKFCSGCGNKIKKQNNNCVRCGNKISPNDKFCGNCGTKISNEEQTEIENSNFATEDTDEESSLAELNERQEEIKALDEILELAPRNISALTDKGFSLIRLGRYKEAIEVCDEILELAPEDMNALVNKGVSLIRLGRYQEAIEVCDEALELDPENANVLSGKGTSLMKLNEYEEATEVLNEALELNPQDMNALSDRDFCLKKLETTNRYDNNQVKYENINNVREQSSFDYYKEVLKKYSDFSGRSTRAEYWYFMLYNIIIAISIAFLEAVIGGEEGILYVLYLFIVFIPQLAVSVRRLHDIGKSGWIFLVSIIPLIGFLWMLILFTTDSDAGTNKYGPNPKNR